MNKACINYKIIQFIRELVLINDEDYYSKDCSDDSFLDIIFNKLIIF